MMKTKLILFALSTLLMSSCGVFKTYTVKTYDIYGSGVIQKPVIVDLEVSDFKVTGKATAVGKSLDEVKKLAVYDAIKTANADVLVEPQFITETQSGSTTATVTGYPALYKNFRPITLEDVDMLKAGILQKANVYEPTEEKKRKK
jgi:hypothetical protein